MTWAVQPPSERPCQCPLVLHPFPPIAVISRNTSCLFPFCPDCQTTSFSRTRTWVILLLQSLAQARCSVSLLRDEWLAAHGYSCCDVTVTLPKTETPEQGTPLPTVSTGRQKSPCFPPATSLRLWCLISQDPVRGPSLLLPNIHIGSVTPASLGAVNTTFVQMTQPRALWAGPRPTPSLTVPVAGCATSQRAALANQAVHLRRYTLLL